MFRLAYLQAVISLSGRFRFGFHACAAAGYIFCKRGQMCPPVCEDRLLQDSAAVGINVTVLKEGVINFVSLNFSYWDISAHR